MNKPKIAIVGAGINGLVAANYLQRAGCHVSLIERAEKVGGACISASTQINGIEQHYALGASVLGLMQKFVFEQTGLASRLKTFVPTHPKLIHFVGEQEPAWIYRDAAELDRELADKWGERGQVEAFRADEAKVVDFLIKGYEQALPPTVEQAKLVLGETLTQLWISGSARTLLDHYFTSERSKLYMAMTVTESGPVSLDEPYSAFTLPLMDSGTIFGGYYGFVKGGIWQITEQLGVLNSQLGVVTHLEASVEQVDPGASTLTFSKSGEVLTESFDHLIFGTDPITAARLLGEKEGIDNAESKRYLGSSGKLNLMFRKPVRWKHGSNAADSDAAFRFIFSVDTIDDFQKATTSVSDGQTHYDPGFMQIYCEGAAMRQIGHKEPFDRLAVFFKNLGLTESGESLQQVEQEVKNKILEYVENPSDCVWTRLLTPKDLQTLFLFPGGNLDHTMLVGGQTYFDRTFSDNPAESFYRFGSHENVSICGSATYPCGSVAGTAGYMCSQQLIRALKPRTTN
jgi:phytoene dehydrogenase-like protein